MTPVLGVAFFLSRVRISLPSTVVVGQYRIMLLRSIKSRNKREGGGDWGCAEIQLAFLFVCLLYTKLKHGVLVFITARAYVLSKFYLSIVEDCEKGEWQRLI